MYTALFFQKVFAWKMVEHNQILSFLTLHWHNVGFYSFCVFCCNLGLYTECQQVHMSVSVGPQKQTFIFLSRLLNELNALPFPATLLAGSHLLQQLQTEDAKEKDRNQHRPTKIPYQEAAIRLQHRKQDDKNKNPRLSMSVL